ncbi:MAG: C10 family peptidase [Bacteroides sp.]|nr:C10 family peptidase [Bacteroides sp.]
MKFTTMIKRSLLLILVGFLSLASCTEDVTPTLSENDLSENTGTLSPEMTAIGNYINKKHPSQSRAGEISLEPYVLNGDTVMFIANYGEENGWEVFSNETSVPMLLMKSEKGHFDPDDGSLIQPIQDIFETTAQEIWNIKTSTEAGNDTICNEWKLYNREMMVDPASIRYDFDENQDYTFLVSSDVTETTTILEPAGGRLITKWNQNYFYRLYTPFYEDMSDTHSPVGCVPVAFGQFFYHSHYNFGHPVYAVTDAWYNSTTNTYIFSGLSSTVWDSFNSNPDRWYDLSNMKSTAIFLGNIGKSINVSYGKKYYN